MCSNKVLNLNIFKNKFINIVDFIIFLPIFQYKSDFIKHEIKINNNFA